jgi:polycomb protein EED
MPTSVETTTPNDFKLSGSAKECHGHPIYAVAWSPYVYRMRSDDDGDGHYDHDAPTTDGCGGIGDANSQRKGSDDIEDISYFATCSERYATIYEVINTSPSSDDDDDNNNNNNNNKSPPSNGSPQSLSVRQVYEDEDEGEYFYAIAFGARGVGSPAGHSPLDVHDSDINETDTNVVHIGGRAEQSTKKPNSSTLPSKRQKTTSSNTPLLPCSSTQNGPPLLCLAGIRGVIKIIDTVRRSLFLTLDGHNDAITDLQFCPTNEWLLLSSSNDESIRLWNVQTGTNIAVFAGHCGHRGHVLSISWHCSGERFASAGMDNVVKLWNVTGEEDGNEKKEGIVEKAVKDSWKLAPKCFSTVIQQFPYFSTTSVHSDYVDCVQFVGDLLLSKSVNNTVVLWKPLLNDEGEARQHAESESSQHCTIPSSILFLREFALTHCSNWFVRFHSPPPFYKILALGNQKREVKLWNIGGDDGCHPSQKPFCTLVTRGGGIGFGDSVKCSTVVRMVRFSHCGSSLVAVCDDSTIWLWQTQ